MRWRSGQPGSPYIIGRGCFGLCFISLVVDVIVCLDFRIGLCRFEDSAEFPRCTLLFKSCAYIINVCCFAFICALLEGPVKLLSG